MFEKKKSGDQLNQDTPNQQPQFTKRRQFLFLKIRSRPIGQASIIARLTRIKRSSYEWLTEIVLSSLAGFYTKVTGFSYLEAVLVAVLFYIVLSAFFSSVENVGTSRVKRERKVMSMLAKKPAVEAVQLPRPAARPSAAPPVRPKPAPAKKPTGPLSGYILSILAARKTLESDLRTVGVRKSAYDFVKTMILYSVIISVVISVVLIFLLNNFGAPLVLAPVFGLAVYMVVFNRFLLYPSRRYRLIGKNVERDILFAARDLVIGMRSGMPLYNAITSVSSGYGDASKEFGKIIELVQLGMPIEQAMEEVSDKSESVTFKRLMLQASVSIKAGVDVTTSLQEVVDEVIEERVIELRRYGQKLNALAMFYMLFGVIFPSMGIAVATIMSTFVNIFPVTYVVLVLALVFIVFIQIILLNIMRNSRPIFAL